jgi:hypothetical protein
MRSVLEYTRLNDFLIISLAYIVGYLVVDFIVAPVQYLYLSRDFTVGSLMFIPHGIRVLAVWLCGSRAILPLIISELLCTVLLWQPDVAISTSLGSSMVGGLCVYLTFEVFRLAGIEMRPDGKDSALTNWRSLILLASIASVFNSVGKQIFFGSLAPLGDDILIIGIFWIGDTIGTFACLLFLMGIRRRFQS